MTPFRSVPALVAGLLVAGPAIGGERADWTRTPATALQACPNFGIRVADGESCIRFGGSVRAETGARLAGTRGSTAGPAGRTLTRTVTHLSVDVRTPTELGPVRAFASVRVSRGATPTVLEK